MQAHSLLEFSKQRFDFVASPPRTLVSWRSSQSADGLPDGFLLMHKQSAIGPRRASFLLRAVRALRFRRAIEVALAVPPAAVERERLSLRTVVGILRRFVTKLVASEAPFRLMTTVYNRNVRLHAAIQQPRQKLSTAVCLIGSYIFRSNPQFLGSLDHPARSNGLLREPCRCGFYSQDDPTGRIDEIVIVVSHLGCSPTLACQDRVWVRGGDHFRTGHRVHLV